MSDVTERLAALDPAARDPYKARDLDQMITRIVSSSPSGTVRSAWWQRVQLRIGAALILGTAVGAGTVAIVSGGPTLAALAIQTAVTHHPGVFSTAKTPESYQETDFASAGSLLSSRPPTSTIPSFKMSIPKNSAHEAAHLASIFRVVGATRHRGNDWTVTSSSGAALDYQTSGTSPQWYYSLTTPSIAPATASSSTDSVMPSHGALNEDAHKYLKRLGFDYSVTSPVFSESTVSTTTGGAPSSQGQEEVSYTVAVDGIDTDQTVSFSVDAQNTVVYAQGPAFEVGSGTHYPLESPRDGVSSLNVLERSAFPVPAVGASAASPAVVHARLTSESISLATFRLTNGTRWLLPLYTYSGSVSRSNTTSVRTWSEIAIAPSYVRLTPSEARSLLNN
jgi:hypothetical protein